MAYGGVPTIPLRNASKPGMTLPVTASGCAFGNWTSPDVGYFGFKPEDANRALTMALDNGVRAFDGAHFYQTEQIFGRLLGERFANGKLKREDVWVQTKVVAPVTQAGFKVNPYRAFDWIGMRTASDAAVREAVLRQFWTSLDELGLGWVDLVLMHFPSAYPAAEGEPALTETEARRLRKVIYTTLLEMHASGAARAVGVSNFAGKHLQQLKEDLPADTPLPAVNQVELTPYAFDRKLVATCKELNVVLQAYAPFASGAHGLLQDPVLVGLADAKKVTVGQVIQQWLWKRGAAAVPKSTSAARIKASLDLTSFTLSEEELASIDALSEGKEPRRTCPDPNAFV